MDSLCEGRWRLDEGEVPHLAAHVVTERMGYTHDGEDDYRITSHNCEHFCEWCVQGESRSRQIESWQRTSAQSDTRGHPLRSAVPGVGSVEQRMGNLREQ